MAKRILLFFSVLLILTAKVNQVNAEAVVGNQINVYAGEGDQTDQSAAFDSENDRFLMVWNDNFSEETSWDIYGQLINSYGEFTDEETIIITVRSKRVKVIPYPR